MDQVKSNKDFDKWLELDQKLCNVYKKINKEWVYGALHTLFQYHDQSFQDEVIKFFDDNYLVTGSTKENTAICRMMTADTMDLEIDQSYRIGRLDKNAADKILVPTETVGYYKVKTTVFDHLLSLVKNQEFMAALCLNLNNANDFYKIFDEGNEFVPTNSLKEWITACFAQGNKNPDNVELHGPASTAACTMNGLIRNLFVSASKQGIWGQLKVFEPVSLNDFINKEVDKTCDNETDDFFSLYKVAFPINESSINILFFIKFLQKIEKEPPKKLPSIFFNLISSSGYIPYFEIKEFGNLYFDHVASIHLDFWPDIASKWLNKKDRIWPDEETFARIKTYGSFIVPKSTSSEKEKAGDNYEWRISFSGAEIILSQSLTEFQRKCYLVAKCIYYTTIKKIDGDKFGSYFIKTIMFKILEKVQANFWENSSMEGLVKVLERIFKELSDCFCEGKLTSLFTDEINLLEGIDHRLLQKASSKALAVYESPLSFLPKDSERRLESIEKAIVFGDGFLLCLRKVDEVMKSNALLLQMAFQSYKDKGQFS